MRASWSIGAGVLIGRASSFVFSVSIRSPPKHQSLCRLKSSVSAFDMLGDTYFINRGQLPLAQVMRLNATPGKCSENHIAVPARVQHFVGSNHRCGSDPEAPSQAPNTIYGLPTVHIHELANQQKSFNHHKVSASHPVRFGSAQLCTQIPERGGPDGAVRVRIGRWAHVIV